MRYLIIVLLLSGAHFSLIALVPAPRAWWGWPFGLESPSALAGVGQLPSPVNQRVTSLLALAAGFAFLAAVLALLGWLVPAELFGILVVMGAGSSSLLYALHVSTLAWLPIGLNLVLLWGVLGLHWTAAMLKGG